jgi:hypothetical protein
MYDDDGSKTEQSENESISSPDSEILWKDGKTVKNWRKVCCDNFAAMVSAVILPTKKM